MMHYICTYYQKKIVDDKQILSLPLRQTTINWWSNTRKLIWSNNGWFIEESWSNA
uniref:Uncharacterized protein n=1 Tax=Helianthus annuus TaxID=4232 RepID=A0A251RLT7_HELAN